ncbi:solute carrier family 35 member D3 [Protopterus annectens]|uniref:solute carrier family 35 member D3 n=1 Tax=Protopterus annectens TaxID=7888 RepID=UPI001CFA1BEA|nr:solute carrier family 35 member D3 [Protopterus annectens]
MQICKGRLLGISVAVAHGVFSGSLNILLKLLISKYNFMYLTLIQCLTSSTAAVVLEVLRRLGRINVPPYSFSLARVFATVTLLSTLQSSLTLWALRGLSLPMYVVFKRCLPLVTLLIGVCVLKNGIPSVGVVIAVLITTCGAALAGAGDLTGDPIGYVTGILAVIIHAAYLVIIQKTSYDSEYGPLTAQYAIAVTATPLLIICSFASLDSINAWSFEGWLDPSVTCTFVACILIGCAMNFTTLHCTYINSAVTTSFVGVVKSIVTITVGMLAFDMEPTNLFVAGVVVNTVGSIIYCTVKYFETRKHNNYEDLEDDEDLKSKVDNKPPEEPLGMDVFENKATNETAANGLVVEAEGEANNKEVTYKDKLENSEDCAEGSKSRTEEPSSGIGLLASSYAGVWRLIRNVKVSKTEYLIDSEELQSP